MKYQSRVCPNGLTALAAPQRELPLVSLQVWVETGSAHEAEFSGAGISHLLEHMVFKGTEEFSGQELNERVPAFGGLWNAYTSTDRTVYHIDGPAEHWREFLHLLVQLTLHPTFPEDKFERERDVIRREMAMYDDDHADAAPLMLLASILGDKKQTPVRYQTGEQNIAKATAFYQVCPPHDRQPRLRGGNKPSPRRHLFREEVNKTIGNADYLCDAELTRLNNMSIEPKRQIPLLLPSIINVAKRPAAFGCRALRFFVAQGLNRFRRGRRGGHLLPWRGHPW